jgi:D-alanyl-D-alanine carboxypeptidase (penicillin-binding protein 5/6)
MTIRRWHVAWGLLVLIAALIGIIAKVPDLSVGQVLSQQDIPPPAPFPVRLEKTADYSVRARYAVLIDKDSFYQLYAKEARTPVPVASTTKLMTAIVAWERFGSDAQVTVSRKATLQIGSTTGLVAGEVLTVHSLLSALLIQSGNDAAYALAEHSGGVETFVDFMNEKAREFGLRSTQFQDPAGLNDEGFSSAFDLAVLAARFLEYDELVAITKTAEAEIYSTDGVHSHRLKNSNRLVTEEMFFPGILGLKTGFTPAAGHTLVSAASKGGRTLIAVVLSTFDDTKEASAIESNRLLSWGFSSHRWEFPRKDN